MELKHFFFGGLRTLQETNISPPKNGHFGVDDFPKLPFRWDMLVSPGGLSDDVDDLFVSPVRKFFGKKDMPLSTESSGALEFRQRCLGSVFFLLKEVFCH